MFKRLFAFSALLAAPIAAAQEVYLVNFTSEYCSVCKVLDPKLDAATQGYDPARMQRVVLDFTSPDTSQAAYDRVNGTLLANPYADYVGVTGIGVLTAADSGETIECLVAGMSSDVMRSYIDRAVEVVREQPVGMRNQGSMFCPPANTGVRIE